MDRTEAINRETAVKRIAFVLPHLHMGGIEHVVLRLANELDRRRFRPFLFLRSVEGTLLREVARDVQVIDGQGRRAMLLAPFLAGSFRREAVDLVYSGTNAMNLACVLALALMPHRAKPRLIISEHTSARAYLAGAKARRIRRALVQALYPRADLLVAPLETIACDWIDTMALAGLAYAVAPNPVLASGWRAGGDLPNQRQSGLVVAAGRLIPDKGFDGLVRAFAAVARGRANAHLTIFGEGPERAKLEALVDAEGMAGRISLPGITDELLHEFARAPVVAVSSRREGFGNVVIEALAAGAQVVATDCAGPRALLQGLAQGQIVPVGDRHALAAALAERLDHQISPADQIAAQARAASYGVEQAVAVFASLAERVLVAGPNHKTDSPIKA